MPGDSVLPAVREYRNLSDVRSLAAGRFDRARQPHMFDRFDWLDALHRHCMADRESRVVRACEGDAEAWLFLTNVDGRHSAALSNWYSFAFRPIFTGTPDALTQQRLIEGICRHLARQVAQVELYPIVADDGTRDLLLKAFGKAGWLAVPRPMGMNHYLDLNGRDFAAYWNSRPGTLRSTVRRKGKAALFHFELHERFSEDIWADYLSVYGRSWKQEEPNYSFLRALAEQEGAAGTLRMGIARQGDEAVAVQLWTVENGVAMIHKLAHDSRLDAASPGTLLSHFLFRHAIDGDQVSRIDYGTGDNPYKTEWMDSQRPLYRIDCFNPRFSSAWLPAARTAISKLVG